MKRVKGRYNGSAIVLEEKIDLPANTRVDVLIPEREERPPGALLDELDRMPVGEVRAAQR